MAREDASSLWHAICVDAREQREQFATTATTTMENNAFLKPKTVRNAFSASWLVTMPRTSALVSRSQTSYDRGSRNNAPSTEAKLNHSKTLK